MIIYGIYEGTWDGGGVEHVIYFKKEDAILKLKQTVSECEDYGEPSGRMLETDEYKYYNGYRTIKIVEFELL